MFSVIRSCLSCVCFIAVFLICTMDQLQHILNSLFSSLKEITMCILLIILGAVARNSFSLNGEWVKSIYSCTSIYILLGLFLCVVCSKNTWTYPPFRLWLRANVPLPTALLVQFNSTVYILRHARFTTIHCAINLLLWSHNLHWRAKWPASS
jgi:hypothetical protein